MSRIPVIGALLVLAGVCIRGCKALCLAALLAGCVGVDNGPEARSARCVARGLQDVENRKEIGRIAVEAIKQWLYLSTGEWVVVGLFAGGSGATFLAGWKVSKSRAKKREGQGNVRS